jgi:hypothetical protein
MYIKLKPSRAATRARTCLGGAAPRPTNNTALPNFMHQSSLISGANAPKSADAMQEAGMPLGALPLNSAILLQILLPLLFLLFFFLLQETSCLKNPLQTRKLYSCASY